MTWQSEIEEMLQGFGEQPSQAHEAYEAALEYFEVFNKKLASQLTDDKKEVLEVFDRMKAQDIARLQRDPSTDRAFANQFAACCMFILTEYPTLWHEIGGFPPHPKLIAFLAYAMILGQEIK